MPAAGEPDLNEKLAEVLAICQRMNSERDLSTLLDLIAQEAINLLGADRASIFLLDPETNELWAKVALGSSESIRFDAGLGIAGKAALTGETINVRDAYNDPRFYAAIDGRTGYQTRTLLAVPLLDHNGVIIGAFEVLNKKAGVFTAKDEDVLRSLASHAGIAIETAQLIGRLRNSQDALIEQNAHLWREVERRFSTHKIIGTSLQIQGVVRLIERIRDSSVNVLITGETGTGKELVAKAIHYNSPRSRRPFVALNCAALPETLLESELFGIEKGVATGVQARVGQFQAAEGGTLFLDEIGDLSLTAQAKILRVLQERVIERVGGRSSIPVDVRILAATNKDLEAQIANGSFRDDLYYRLKVIHIHLPPLREIPGDIPLLANHFLREYCREIKKEPMEFASGALRRLVDSPWPGNIRQLQNEINRLVACAQGRMITEEDLIEGIPAPGGGDHGVHLRRERSLKKAVADLEKQMIAEALRVSHNNQQHAAKALGVSRQGLINKMKRYGIKASNSVAAAL